MRNFIYTFRKEDIIGIDLGGLSLKVASVSTHSNMPVLSYINELPTEHNPFTGPTKNLNPHNLAKSMEQALADYHIKNKKIVMVLPEELFLQKFITQPKPLTKAELAIELSINSDEYFIVQKRLKAAIKNSKQGNCLVTAIKKSSIEYAYEAAALANLEVFDIISESEAYSQLLSRKWIQENKKMHDHYSPAATLVIDIGRRKTLLMLFVKNELRFVHILDFGSETISFRIAMALRISLSEANIMKKEKGIYLDEYDVSARHAITELLDIWTAEIKKMKEFYRENILHPHDSEQAIRFITFFGGGSEMKGLPQYLSLSTEIPLPASNIKDIIDCHNLVDKNVSNKFAVAVGAVLVH